MTKLIFAAWVLALAGLTAISTRPAPSTASHQSHPVVQSAGTCDSKHCSANTHCCYGCTGSPICVKNGVPCPECAPR